MPRPSGKRQANPAKKTNTSHRTDTSATMSATTQQLTSDPLPTRTELLARGDDESSMDENESGRSTVPDVFRARAKVRNSHVWLPENGIEIEENGQVRWKCMRCPDPKSAKTFAVSTTKNAIDHLKSKHSIGYGGELITPGPKPHQQRLGDDAINALECLKSWQRDGGDTGYKGGY